MTRGVSWRKKSALEDRTRTTNVHLLVSLSLTKTPEQLEIIILNHSSFILLSYHDFLAFQLVLIV